jgi:hypothetical protein
MVYDGSMMGVTNQPPDLLPGTLDLLILRMLVAGPLYGYAIADSAGPLGFSLAEVAYFTEHASPFTGFVVIRRGGGDQTLGDEVAVLLVAASLCAAFLPRSPRQAHRTRSSR